MEIKIYDTTTENLIQNQSDPNIIEIEKKRSRGCLRNKNKKGMW